MCHKNSGQKQNTLFYCTICFHSQMYRSAWSIAYCLHCYYTRHGLGKAACTAEARAKKLGLLTSNSPCNLEPVPSFSWTLTYKYEGSTRQRCSSVAGCMSSEIQSPALEKKASIHMICHFGKDSHSKLKFKRLHEKKCLDHLVQMKFWEPRV